jgi:hypothetical protein
MFAQL